MEQTLSWEMWKMKERRDNRENDGEIQKMRKKSSLLRPDAHLSALKPGTSYIRLAQIFLFSSNGKHSDKWRLH